MGLLGPNGAGKTTTVRMMTTLTVPTSGTARVAGYDVRTEPAMVRSNMGLTGQAATVDELLTGRENIRMIGALYGIGRRDVARLGDQLLEQFAIADAADRPVKSYSGGMRRRIDLAVSLIASPPVLFLDEPTTGLDPRSRIDLWDVLRGSGRAGHHAAAHHPVPRRGRPARGPHRRRRPRPHHRRGHTAATQAAGGQCESGGHGVARRRSARRPRADRQDRRRGTRRHRRAAADRDGRGHRRHDQGGRLACRTAGSRSTTSACPGPASTTCSSRSPGIAPKTTRSRRPEHDRRCAQARSGRVEAGHAPHHHRASNPGSW